MKQTSLEEIYQRAQRKIENTNNAKKQKSSRTKQSWRQTEEQRIDKRIKEKQEELDDLLEDRILLKKQISKMKNELIPKLEHHPPPKVDLPGNCLRVRFSQSNASLLQ